LETPRNTGEDANAAKARKTEAVPSAKEVEERKLDHSVFRSWCPHCVKGGAEAHGHKSGKSDKREAPMIGMDDVCMHSEQEKEEEKGMPIVVLKDEITKITTAKVVPSKRIDACAVDSMRKALEQLGHRWIILRRDKEPSILALKEAVRTESEIEIV
jgi:hypothetical protein